MSEEKQSYRVWIEAEEWASGQWIPEDGNTDVMVTFQDGHRWLATFIAYKNIQTLTEKHRKTGENLFGAYVWISDMVLVDEISCSRIEAIIHDLLKQGEFESIFGYCGVEELGY